MSLPPGFGAAPARGNYDVIIIGGAMMGSATAWFLSRNPDFDGSVLVIERDQLYRSCSTAHTNSCIRQQFSHPLNVRISRFGADFINDFRRHLGDDPRVPDLSIRAFGYLYLAGSDAAAEVLRENQAVQRAEGAQTELLTPDAIRTRYPFYDLDGIVLGSINCRDEGYWDGAAVFDWWRRQAREGGTEYLADTVVAINRSPAGDRVESVTLASGTTLGCGQLVNCTGPRAARTAAMAGITLPVEPRKRYSWIFKAERPLDRDLPLTIDPSGVHVRENGGGTYLAGGHADHDPAVEPDDFGFDHDLWLDHVWPAIAARIPQFEAVRVQSEWVGHYAMNPFDQNAIVGPHPTLRNFVLMNGFSGHGLQQSPAMGRGVSEWLTYGEYRSLDLSPFGYDRLVRGCAMIEKAVI